MSPARIPPPGVWLLPGAILSLTACVGIASQRLVLGSADGGFQYHYGRPFGLDHLTAAVVASAAAALLALAMPPASGRRDWTTLIVWVAAVTALQAGTRTVAPFSLERLFVSSQSNSFYSVAAQHDPADLLARFHRIRDDFPLHAQSNMPGKILLVHALRLVSERTDVLPWAVVVLSNLGALLMYRFAADLFGDRRVGLISALFYLFTPARLLFPPLMNTVTPVLMLGSACLLVRWVRTGSTLFAGLLGGGLYCLALFEPLPFVAGLLFAAIALAAVARGEIAWQRFAAQACVVVATFVVVSEAVAAVWGFRFFRVFPLVGGHAVDFNRLAARPYRIWIAANLREFAFGAGLCQVAGFFAAIAHALRAEGSWLERLTRPVTLTCLGLFAVLTAVDLIGVNRGEVLRLWIFLACLFQLPAAFLCAQTERAWPVVLVVVTSTLQAVLSLATLNVVVPG